jgi:hypothetical protein
LRKSLVWLLLAGLVAFLMWTFLRREGQVPQPESASTPTRFKLNIPQKALWRNYLFVSVEAAGGASCRLTYIPPSGNKKVMNVTADSSGLCEWQWKIEEADGKGNARLIFTIDGASETHFIEVRSSF